MRFARWFSAASPMLLAVSLVTCCTSCACGQGLRSNPPSPPRSANMVELLSAGANDLVVVGTVDSSASVFRGFAETCGVTGYSWDRYLEIRLRVEQVIFGVAEDSVLRVTVIENAESSLDGHHVIVRAYRSCDDAWRLRGRVYLLDGGVVTPTNMQQMQFARASNVPLRQDELLTSLASVQPNPARIYAEAEGLVLARINVVHGWANMSASYDVEPITVLAGHGTVVPKVVTFPELPDCYPNMFAGDSLIVPIPTSWVPGDTLKLANCPSALRVKFGFAPGLGRPVNDLMPAFIRIGNALFARSVQKKPTETEQ